MKVIENKPAPVVQPPTTYDITGLTRAELEMIRAALGHLTVERFATTSDLVGFKSTYDGDRHVELMKQVGSALRYSK